MDVRMLLRMASVYSNDYDVRIAIEYINIYIYVQRVYIRNLETHISIRCHCKCI